MNFTPGELDGTMNTHANFLSCTGMRPWCATKVKLVSAEPVATTLAPDTTMPASVSLSLDVHADVGDLVRRAVAVDRRMDDRVVDVGDALLAVAVPALRVLGVGVERGIRTERAQERRLVVRRAPEPAVGEPLPRGDRVATGNGLRGVLRRSKVGVSFAAARVGRNEVLRALLGVVKRIVETGEHAGRVTERRMLARLLHALAVDVDLSAVVDRF